MKRLNFVFFCLSFYYASAQEVAQNTVIHTKKSFPIYDEGWIDFNKNGTKDPYEDMSLLVEERVDDLLSKMTLEEKVGMVHANGIFSIAGVKRLGIPDWRMSDGPHGVRMELGNQVWQRVEGADDNSTYFPTGISMAATWNTELAGQFGMALGKEARARGKDVILGPGFNINRTPLGGRNFEYMGEDPYLISQMVVPIIQNIQKQDVAACAKHFVANNQEQDRFKVNVEMDERTLREIYLPPFKAAVQEGEVYTVMGAYNKFRGEYATHNKYLVNDILKGEWGFDGVLVSDWGAVHDMSQAARNGTDIEMGTYDPWFSPHVFNSAFTDKFYFLGDEYLNALKTGKESEVLLNDKVRRVLSVMLCTKVLNPANREKGQLRGEAHKHIALATARESIVLLKNENSLLPLDLGNIQSVAVIGENAVRKHANEGGSSQVKSAYEITPLEGIKAIFGGKVEVKYSPGTVSYVGHQSSQKFIDDAASIAKSSDVAVIVTGLTHYGGEDTEGSDKANLSLPKAQDQLIDAVTKANPNTIVVIMSGGVVDMSQWIESTPSILQMWYAGQEGGTALAEILAGQVNPSGKLPVTFPKVLSDIPAHKHGTEGYPGKDLTVNYAEGIFVGYRYFDTYNVEPLFPFGHGLSYTAFEYSGLKVKQKKDDIIIDLTIANTSDLKGKEVVQVYIRDVESSVERPLKELKSFKKIELNSGELQDFQFTIPTSNLSFYSKSDKRWVFEAGEFEVLIGSSSRDIRLTQKVKLK